jgi:ribonuclease BN (tRNA processing enzyme)
MPTAARATACLLLRERAHALAIDVGTGAHRLVTEPSLLDGVDRLDVLITHFHLDHVCGLAYLPALDIRTVVWAPGEWLYGRRSERILADLQRPPFSPFSATELLEVKEVSAGEQQIGRFSIFARAQPRHWAPTAGFRINDFLALITDTGYDPGSVELASGVEVLMHEAWSSSSTPDSADMDASGADAGRVAAGAGVQRLVLIHLNPRFADQRGVLADARRFYLRAELGADRQLFSDDSPTL